MTKQIESRFTYEGVPARALALYKRILFLPAEKTGIETGSWANMNYNGFWCDYSVDRELIIRNLYIFSKDHNYPEINGVKAEEVSLYRGLADSINKKYPERNLIYINTFPMLYRDVCIKCEYTGRIILGLEQKNERVYDAVFEKGAVTESVDITDKWRLFMTKRKASGYWWEKEDRRYFYLGYEVTDPRLVGL